MIAKFVVFLLVMSPGLLIWSICEWSAWKYRQRCKTTPAGPTKPA
jgi:hypothetical protein